MNLLSPFHTELLRALDELEQENKAMSQSDITIVERNCRTHPPTGERLAGCTACLRTFGGDRGFDMHRKGGQCVHPYTAGLLLDKRGVWVQPRPAVFTTGTVIPATLATSEYHGEGSEKSPSNPEPSRSLYMGLRREEKKD